MNEKEGLIKKLQSIRDRSNFASSLNINFIEVDKGYYKSEVIITDKLTNSMGTCHGGATAGIIDSMGGAATYTLLDEDEFFSTMNFRIDFLAPIKAGEKLTGIAKVLRKGTRVILVEVNLYNEKEDLVANGMVSNLILKKKET